MSNGPIVCTSCLGSRRVTSQQDPKMSHTCSRCMGTGNEPCSAAGCGFDAVTQVSGSFYCDADAGLIRNAVTVG